LQEIPINFLSGQKNGKCLSIQRRVKLCTWEGEIRGLSTLWNVRLWIQSSVDSEKDLSIMISSDLKSSNQCVQACRKASKMLGMIKRTISYKKPEIMVKLYKALVRPYLEYCVSAWS